MRLPMSRLGKVALVLLVLALVVVGLPVGMPMASCPQCVLPAGAMCLLAMLTAATAAAVRIGPAGGLACCRFGCRPGCGPDGWTVLRNGCPSRSRWPLARLRTALSPTARLSWLQALLLNEQGQAGPRVRRGCRGRAPAARALRC
jgi:hypothetical protein